MINEYVVKTYCNEDISLIENYDKAISDSNQTWHCHHRRELETPRKQLIKIGEYYNRPASELIFLTHSEHTALHNKGNKNMLGKYLSEDAKRKLSESHKGKKYQKLLKESTCPKNIKENCLNLIKAKHLGIKAFTGLIMA